MIIRGINTVKLDTRLSLITSAAKKCRVAGFTTATNSTSSCIIDHSSTNSNIKYAHFSTTRQRREQQQQQSLNPNIADFRSDTVTKPTQEMLQCALNAPTGDDVFGEDPTVLELEEYVADLTGKEKGLFVPTGTMSNLVGILAHCHGRASEIIVGSQSHINLWEGGGVANLGGIYSRQIQENGNGKLDLEEIKDCYRTDNDDHFPKTELICLENTHNMMGGIALPKSYIDDVANLAKEELDGIKVHIDGARIFNSAVALDIPMSELCEGADSVSLCLSKGLGAPLGSCLVGETEIIRLAKRARKRVGGGMRQAGVVASMGLYALKNNVDRLADDHTRAKRISQELYNHGFVQPQNGDVDTNIVYFALPEESKTSTEDLAEKLYESYGVQIGYGYSRGGKLFRIVTHMGVNDEDVDRCLEGILKLCL